MAELYGRVMCPVRWNITRYLGTSFAWNRDLSSLWRSMTFCKALEKLVTGCGCDRSGVMICLFWWGPRHCFTSGANLKVLCFALQHWGQTIWLQSSCHYSSSFSLRQGTETKGVQMVSTVKNKCLTNRCKVGLAFKWRVQEQSSYDSTQMYHTNLHY